MSVIDRYVAPIYRLAFLTSALIAVASALFFFASSIVSWALGWVDARWADIGEITVPSAESRLLLSIIAGLVTGMLFVFARISVVQRARIKILQELRRCVEDHIKYYDDLYNIINDASIANDMAVRLISEKSRNHSIFLCSRLAEVFELQTYCACHASIKTFNQEELTVTTRTRDALLHNKDRIVVDEHLQAFDYKRNSAFRRIIEDDKCDVYLNNWLRLSAVMGWYSNANDDWKNNYRATVVMPVTLNKNPAHINADSVIGFVCVDNMCGNFNRRYAKAVLSVFVALITDMMIKLGEMELQVSGGSHG